MGGTGKVRGLLWALPGIGGRAMLGVRQVVPPLLLTRGQDRLGSYALHLLPEEVPCRGGDGHHTGCRGDAVFGAGLHVRRFGGFRGRSGAQSGTVV